MQRSENSCATHTHRHTHIHRHKSNQKTSLDQTTLYTIRALSTMWLQQAANETAGAIRRERL